MPETPGDSNDLVNKVGVLVGHGAGIHPTLSPGFVCVYIVRIADQWVMCMREGDGLYDWGRARKGLGATMAGVDFADHAFKGIGLTLPFWRLKKYIEDSFNSQKITFEWIDEDDEPWEHLLDSDALEKKTAAQEARWAKEEAMVPGAKVRTLRGWVEQAPIPVEGTLGRIVKNSKRTPPGVVCVEFTPPLVVHETQEELPEDYGAYRLYYSFDDVEIVEENTALDKEGTSNG
jgi:hypothetical protein